MIYVALALLGVCLGSFVNALVWRVHEQETEQAKKQPDKKYLKRLSILKGHSMCPHCQHKLTAKDLIPVLSWLSLRGKCRYCRKPISAQYPFVELAMPTLLIASYAWWPYLLQPFAGTIWPNILFGLWVVLLTGFMALTIYDLRWLLLPNRIVYPLFAPALAWAIVAVCTYDRSWLGVAKLIISVTIGGGVFYILYQVSNGKWIGGGDVRLGWLLGLVVLTPTRALLLLFVASLSGTAVSLPLLLNKRLKRHSLVPFGPFLILAAIIVQLFGASILLWYERTVLLT